MVDFPILDDPHPCGIGLRADCCIFLLCGPDGFECGRESPETRAHLIRNKPNMNAQREPTEPFPDCQLKGRANG